MALVVPLLLIACVMLVAGVFGVVGQYAWVVSDSSESYLRIESDRGLWHVVYVSMPARKAVSDDDDSGGVADTSDFVRRLDDVAFQLNGIVVRRQVKACESIKENSFRRFQFAYCQGESNVVPSSRHTAARRTTWCAAGLASWTIMGLGIVFMGMAVLLLRLGPWRTFRRRASECQECGYCLLGNVSGRCPECGAQVETNAIDEAAHGHE